MPKNDNSHAVRLYSSMVKHLGEEEAERIAIKMPLSKSADFNKKFTWAEKICEELEGSYDDSAVKAIRMDCACGPDDAKINKLKKLYESCGSMDEFTEISNAQNTGFTIESNESGLTLIYPQCYCSCVKRVDRTVSKAWCYCTLGYTKRMFERIFEREVGVDLTESVKTGGNACRIRIILR